MKYALADSEKPRTGVDVYVVTTSGKRGVAKYWDAADRWLTMDPSISHGDSVKKWKYADAVLAGVGSV